MGVVVWELRMPAQVRREAERVLQLVWADSAPWPQNAWWRWQRYVCTCLYACVLMLCVHCVGTCVRMPTQAHAPNHLMRSRSFSSSFDPF
jgi:hypothetical protein